METPSPFGFWVEAGTLNDSHFGGSVPISPKAYPLSENNSLFSNRRQAKEFECNGVSIGCCGLTQYSAAFPGGQLQCLNAGPDFWPTWSDCIRTYIEVVNELDRGTHVHLFLVIFSVLHFSQIVKLTGDRVRPRAGSVHLHLRCQSPTRKGDETQNCDTHPTRLMSSENSRHSCRRVPIIFIPQIKRSLVFLSGIDV